MSHLRKRCSLETRQKQIPQLRQIWRKNILSKFGGIEEKREVCSSIRCLMEIRGKEKSIRIRASERRRTTSMTITESRERNAINVRINTGRRRASVVAAVRQTIHNRMGGMVCEKHGKKRAIIETNADRIFRILRKYRLLGRLDHMCGCKLAQTSAQANDQNGENGW